MVETNNSSKTPLPISQSLSTPTLHTNRKNNKKPNEKTEKTKNTKKITSNLCNNNKNVKIKQTLKNKWNINKNDTLVMATLNIRGGFTNKAKFILNWLKKNDIDIAVITEIHIKNDLRKNNTNVIPGYITHINSQYSNKHGIAIVIEDKVFSKVKCIKDMIDSRVSKIEWEVGVEYPEIWGVYAEVHENKKEKFWKKMNKKTNMNSNKAAIMMGDMNLPLDKMKEEYQEEIASIWTDIWKYHNPGIQGYTFFMEGKKSKTRIDTIMCTDKVLEKMVWTGIGEEEPTLSVDHKPVIAVMRLKEEIVSGEKPVIEEETVINIFEATKAQKENFKSELENWEIGGEDINKMEEAIRKKIEDTGIKIFGTRTRKYNNEKPLYIPKEIRKLDQQEKLFRKAKRSLQHWERTGERPNIINKLRKISRKWRPRISRNKEETEKSIKEMHTKIKKELRKTIQDKKQEEINTAIEMCHERGTTDLKKFFNKITQKRGGQNMIKVICTKEGKTITGVQEIKTEITEFFQEKFNSKTPIKEDFAEWWSSKNLEEARTKVQLESKELMKEITVSEIQSFKRQMGNKKATGTDKIAAELIKWSGDNCDKQLATLFNAILTKKKIPDKWHETIIVPIHKKGKREDLENYRPIAITNVMYRLFMKIMTYRLADVIEKTQLLHNKQSAFIKGGGTHERILDMLHTYNDAKRRNHPLYVMFLDIAGAYDTVERWALQEALYKSGFIKDFRDLISDIYSNNYISMMTVGGRTDKYEIPEKIGVRQGCPMSPLLFNIFINSLMVWIEEKNVGYVRQDKSKQIVSGYVDDLAYTTSDLRELKNMIKMTKEFFKFYGMKLSIEDKDSIIKTKTVITTNQVINEPIMYDNGDGPVEIPKIHPNQSYKYLGIWININLQWEEHWNKIYGKIISCINKLSASCYSATASTEICNKVILPIIQYSCMAIHPDEQKLKQIQDRMSRIIYEKMRVGSKYNANWRLQIPKLQGGVGLVNLMAEGLATHWNSLLKEANKGNKYILNRLIKMNRDYRILHPEWEIKTNNYNTLIGNYIKSKKERIILNKQNVTIKEVLDKGSIPEKYLKGMSNKDKEEIKKQLGSGIHKQIRIMEEREQRIGQGTVDVFTDAGRKYKKVIMGLYIPEVIRFKDSMFDNWKQSVQLGEIWIILLALKLIRRETHINLFSDNKNGVNAIKNKMTNGKYGNLIKEILQEIKERQKCGGKTEIFHVYSHLRDGKKEEPKRTQQENEMKRQYGERMQYIIEGNEIADQLTQEYVNSEKYCHKIWGAGDFFFTWQGEIASRREIAKKLTEKWMKSRPTYQEPVNNLAINSKRTRQWFSRIKGGNMKEINLCQKINIGKLQTREKLNKEMEEGNIQLPMVYLWKHCPFHEETKEDVKHVLQCYETRKFCKNLPRDILKQINIKIEEQNKSKEGKIEKIKWFPPLYGKLEEKDKDAHWDMWRGMIPNILEEKLKEIFKENQTTKEVMMEIMDKITKYMRKRWRKRCIRLFKEEN